MAEDLTDTIRENTEGPAEAKGDSVSMRQHDLKDQIEADKYFAGKRAMAERSLCLFLVAWEGHQADKKAK